MGEIHGKSEYLPNENALIEKSLDLMDMVISEPKYNHAGVVAQVLVDVFRKIGLSNFDEVENMLRARKSRVFLVAVPIGYFGDQYMAKVSEMDVNLEYALWVCMNGENEVKEALSEHRVTADDNMRNLRNCGFLVPVMN